MEQKPSDSDLVQFLNLEQETVALEKNYIDAKESLEKVQKELADTQRKKEETDAKAARARNDAEAEKKAHLEEITTYIKQKGVLKKECEELSAKNEQMHRDMSAECKRLQDDLGNKSKELQDRKSSLDKISGELQGKKAELKEEEKQLEILRGEKKALSKKRKSALGVVLVLSLVIMLFEAYYFTEEVSRWKDSCENARDEKDEVLAKLAETEASYEDTETEKKELEDRLAEMENSYENAEKGREETVEKFTEAVAELEWMSEKLAEIEKYAPPVTLKVNDVYNADKNGNKLKNGDLEASEMRYLTFDCDVCFLDDSIQEATLSVDIYDPSGFRKGGYLIGKFMTHTLSKNVSTTGRKVWSWGNENVSIYEAGTYRVDFIYDGTIIHSQKVRIEAETEVELN